LKGIKQGRAARPFGSTCSPEGEGGDLSRNGEKRKLRLEADGEKRMIRVVFRGEEGGSWRKS